MRRAHKIRQKKTQQQRQQPKIQTNKQKSSMISCSTLVSYYSWILMNECWYLYTNIATVNYVTTHSWMCAISFIEHAQRTQMPVLKVRRKKHWTMLDGIRSSLDFCFLPTHVIFIHLFTLSLSIHRNCCMAEKKHIKLTNWKQSLSEGRQAIAFNAFIFLDYCYYKYTFTDHRVRLGSNCSSRNCVPRRNCKTVAAANANIMSVASPKPEADRSGKILS